MIKRRALKETISDPVAKKEMVEIQAEQKIKSPDIGLKVFITLLVGFAGGLFICRFIRNI
ncbi:MAG: hypothetical protein R6V46_18720 [Desulfatiglandaceae bacterium]